MKKSLIASVISILFLSACQAKPSFLKFDLERQGEVYIYIQPFEQEAARLNFNIDKLSAVKSDGSELPLNLSLSEFKGADMTRQRLVASGQLLPGSYSGLSFKVKSASSMDEGGEAPLPVLDEPVKINFPFTIERKKALVIAMSFIYKESVKEKASFMPSFYLFMPDMPIANLSGLVSNHDSDNITLYDKRTGNISKVISTGKGPAGMALDQRLRRAYVALSGDDAVEVIDLLRGDVINRITLSPGDAPREISLTPDGRLLLTANYGSKTVSIIDPLSLIEISRINVGDGPNSVLIDNTGKRAYVFNSLSNTISVIDIPKRLISVTVSTETGPLRGQFNRKGDRLYVFYEWSPYLTVIDTSTLSVVKRVFVGMGFSSMKVNANTDMIYVGKRHGFHVEVYDPFTLMLGDHINAGGGISYMAIDSEGNNLHILLAEQKRLVVVNLTSKRVIAEIDVGDNPFWVTMMGER